MSVPHIDTRYVNGKRELLFGPFAGFSPKFLKEGSHLDLFKSIEFDNIPALWGAFWHNLPLTKYLVKQVAMSFEDRMDDLRKFVPDAKSEDWKVVVAGQRVQVIKRDAFEGGKLEFGTEVVSSRDGRITCLMGASPGASTSVKIMLDVVKKAFPEIMKTENARAKLDDMVPFYTRDMDKEFFSDQVNRVEEILNLNKQEA
jgi:malate dehydrogenase (quinone)